jgi:putative membrane protein
MHVGKSFHLSEFVFWSRRKIYLFTAVSFVPVFLYDILRWKWLSIPWTAVALFGTATAFIVAFKNTQTYNRTVEAQQLWTSILTSSRAWGIFARDLVKNPKTARDLIYRHFAWLTALRYELREPRAWESASMSANLEYNTALFRVPEKETTLESELKKFVPEDELGSLLAGGNKTTALLARQSKAVKEAFAREEMPINCFLEFEKAIKEFLDQQGRCERIKNFPYPRQYAIISKIFVGFFCLLLPFGLLKEFDALNALAPALMKGHMVWWVIPFSVALSWMYASLEQVGASTENPFEGGTNDVPISQISRRIQVELMQMIGEPNPPPLLEPQNDIIL